MADRGRHRGLKRQQEAALSALLSKPTIALAAQTAGVGERTLYRWLHDDTAFQDAYRLARRALVQHAIVSVQQGTELAAAYLRSVLLDAKAPVPSKVAAARTLLEYGLRAVELEDIEARLTTLEAAAQKGLL